MLYFDKPPERSWSLPWHRDRTIAVERNDLPSEQFRNPTRKAGVPHVEAPERLLARMLTFRVHLDAVTDEIGPLVVIPGTHDPADPGARKPVVIHAAAGDILAMRPLISHSSRASQPGTTRHRRIIHVELAADEALPDGYAWRTFERIR